jgi:diaminohydroxyphosphoribosylaminopyrimidine deaminase / 5-amino-6-(5-phosphoribosylamino)uracil reductase
MRRAVTASADRRGTTNPNPTVGAVVLDASGAIVGEGITQPVGQAHAEVMALRAAGGHAAGGTLVVTLAPCRHTGRTPPCTEAIIAAGVARVVFALDDPNDPTGEGAAWLRERGVAVEPGVLADEADAVLGPWRVGAARRRPHLTWKYAATLDGRTAAADGTSRWITGPQARTDVHRERSYCDAVIVGVGTVLADDAQLTVRDWPTTRQPIRVVVDSDARSPATARVLDGAAPTVVAVGEGADEDRVAALRSLGADVVVTPRQDGQVDLAVLLDALHHREVAVAMLEGGATLAASFLRHRLVDRVMGYYAPLVLGAGVPLVGDLGVATLAQGQRLVLDEVSAIGDDVRIVARPMTGSG